MAGERGWKNSCTASMTFLLDWSKKICTERGVWQRHRHVFPVPIKKTYHWGWVMSWTWMCGGPEVDPSRCTALRLLAYLPNKERFYCKRPILCLASSKILTPHPAHRPASVYQACGAEGGHTRWVERGVGGQYFGRPQTQLCTLHMWVLFASKQRESRWLQERAF